MRSAVALRRARTAALESAGDRSARDRLIEQAVHYVHKVGRNLRRLRAELRTPPAISRHSSYKLADAFSIGTQCEATS